jgi:hypothetical protein
MLLFARNANLLLSFAWTTFVHALWQNQWVVCRGEQFLVARRWTTA